MRSKRIFMFKRKCASRARVFESLVHSHALVAHLHAGYSEGTRVGTFKFQKKVEATLLADMAV